MSADVVEQGEYPGTTPEQMSEGAGGLPGTPASSGQTAQADRDNAGEGSGRGLSPTAPGADTVTLTRPLCIDAEVIGL